MLLYAMGDTVWAILDLVLKQAPFPSLADFLYLLEYPFFLAGVILLINRPASRGEMVSNALDLATTLAVAILVFWNLLIDPIIQSNIAASLREQIVLVAYPVGDLVLLGAFLLTIYGETDSGRSQSITDAAARQAAGTRTPQEAERVRNSLSFLAAGLLIWIIADSVYGYKALEGTYASGELLDFSWLAANLLIGLAGASQWASLRPANASAKYQPGRGTQERLRWIKTYLPYAWLLGAFILMIAGALMPLPMSFVALALGVGLVLALVLVRQLIMLSENHRMNLQLKSQAAVLESMNRDLHIEISERERIQERLAFDVLHDQMTGLANRILLLDRLEQALKRSKRHHGPSFALLFMDLDQFKVVNDSLGHSSGDQLLILVAKRLTETLRAGDTVARFGGDEFAILLNDVGDEVTTRRLAGRIQAALEPSFRLKERNVHISASIGIATDLIEYAHADELLRDADIAMYQAKTLGRARSEMFTVELRDRAFSRLVLEEELRRAVENREFQLYYQPITSLESDRVVGVEALLRWCHPSRGLLPPPDFLSVAEESGVIVSIGAWVLGEACRQLKLWQDQYPMLQAVTVNVNISDREFSQPQLVQRVADALNTSGLKGTCLRLEITERVLVNNIQTANEAIAALQNMGVQVQIDDFGTGYSALSYLQQFPINAIKIDRSFINEMGRTPKGLGLVRAMVSMARELHMETIAEGIETGEQLNELKGLLCGFGQGYLLSMPLDAARAEQLLVKQAG